MKKLFFGLLTLLTTNVFAITIPVTEGMVNLQVTNSFPKVIKKIELSNPRIKLIDNKAVLCLDGLPKIMFLEKPFSFCSSFNPQWNEKSTQLEATQLELIDMDIKNIGSVPSVIKGLLNEVLTGIEPITIYKSDSWLIKQIRTVVIENGVLYIKI